jgi:hypothetical protein
MPEPITVVLAERLYALRLQFRDIAKAEGLSGKSIIGDPKVFDLTQAMAGRLTFLLWCALVWRNEFTYQQVLDMVDESNFQHIATAVSDVIVRDVAPIVAKFNPPREPSEDPFAETTGSEPVRSPGTPSGSASASSGV